MIDAMAENALKAAFAPIRPFVKKFITKRQLVLEHGVDGSLFLRIGIQDVKKPGRAIGLIHLTGYPKEIAERYIFEAQRPEEKPEPEKEPEEAEEEVEKNDDEEGVSS